MGTVGHVTHTNRTHNSGHGKGVWDGIGGMMKQWLRTIMSAAQTKRKVILTESGNIATPRDCFEQLSRHFTSDHYREKNSGKY